MFSIDLKGNYSWKVQRTVGSCVLLFDAVTHNCLLLTFLYPGRIKIASTKDSTKLFCYQVSKVYKCFLCITGFLNFSSWQNIFEQEGISVIINLIELHPSFLHSNSFREWTKHHQKIPYERSDVSECLAFSLILKSIVNQLNEKIAKIMFFGTWINFKSSLSLHMQSNALISPPSGCIRLRFCFKR